MVIGWVHMCEGWGWITRIVWGRHCDFMSATIILDALESHGADIHVEWDLCISSLQEVRVYTGHQRGRWLGISGGVGWGLEGALAGD